MGMILKAIEATVGPDGYLRTEKPLPFKIETRVIVTIAVEDGEDDLSLASEKAWSEDWNNANEDEAWASLQEAK